MKFFRYLEITFALCILTLLVGCASSLQKADKMAMSDPKSAVAAYQGVIDANPGSEEARQAHFKMAETYYKRIEDKEKGLEVYEAVAKAYPKTEVSGKANYAIAWHYFNAKDYEKAREKFAQVTQEMPGTEEADSAALAIGKCYEELKKYDEAAQLYTEFSKTHPKHRYAAQAGLDAAKIYNDEGKTDEAVETYKYVASEYGISSSGREARQALTDMGVDLSDVPETQEAEAEAEQEQEEEDASTFGTRRRRRARNVPRPDIGTRQSGGEEQQASSRSVSPDFGVDPMEAMPIVTMDSQGTMYDAMYMFANMNLQSHQYKESGALYEKALQLAGSKPWDNAANAYFGLAKSYKGIGRDDKAVEMFKEAINRDRKVIDRMITSGETQYGEAENEAEYEEALKTYQTALGLVSYKDSEIYYKMGLVYQKLGDADKELESFERSVALKPSFVDAIQHMAEVLFYRKKNTTRADLYDKEARGQGNTDYLIQKELGDLSYKYGYVFSTEQDSEKQSESCYSWAKIKYGNAVRVISRKIDSDLKSALESGDESEAKQIVGDSAKATLKLVSEAAASGNQLASNTLQKMAAILTDYRLMNSRIAISQVRMKQLKQAQQQLDDMKAEDPGVLSSADFHLALGELALAQGDNDTGMSEIKKALEINPEHEEAARRLAELGA